MRKISWNHPSATALPSMGQWLVLVCFGLAAETLVAQTETTAKTNETALVFSEFRDDPKFGKDPFFPQSTRRSANEPVSVGPVVSTTKLKLQGISGTKEKRLAIINNRTFEEGEEAELKVEGQPTRVRCIKIGERSAQVLVNKQGPQEIFLGQHF